MTVEFITDPRLAPITHGFFTRKGGASSGVFAGLNCGEGSSDQGEIVRLNRRRANCLKCCLSLMVIFIYRPICTLSTDAGCWMKFESA